MARTHFSHSRCVSNQYTRSRGRTPHAIRVSTLCDLMIPAGAGSHGPDHLQPSLQRAVRHRTQYDRCRSHQRWTPLVYHAKRHHGHTHCFTGHSGLDSHPLGRILRVHAGRAFVLLLIPR